MPVTNQNSTQYDKVAGVTDGNLEAHENHGRVRMAYFSHTQDGAGTSGSTVAAVKLPAGKVRLLGPMSNIYFNWTTASAKADIGWDAYVGLDGNEVAADPDGLDDNLDVDAAGAKAICSIQAAEGGTKLFESQDGVTLRLTSPTAIADTNTAAGYVAYVID